MLLQALFRSVPSLRRWDQRRHGLPAEHWATFALGLYLLKRRRSGPLGWLLSRAAGAGLVARALSGRDGAVQVYQRVRERQDGGRATGAARSAPAQGGAASPAASEEFVEVAAPWPYDERVKVSSSDTGARH